MNFTENDLNELQSIGFFGEQDTIASITEVVNKYIDNWNEIVTEDMTNISLGYYYIIFLLPRSGLQTIIEHVNQESQNIILQKLASTDSFFKERMKPKYFHYDDEISSVSAPFFWRTHTIHPIDMSIKVTPTTICRAASEILDQIDGSWEILGEAFSKKGAKNILRDYRDTQIIAPRLLIEYFMYRYSNGLIEMSDYDKTYIDNHLNDYPSVDFTHRLFFGLLAQFLDFGKLEKQELNWASKCLDRIRPNPYYNSIYDIDQLNNILSKLSEFIK